MKQTNKMGREIRKMKLNRQDIQGNYEVTVVAGNSEPMSNLCQFCGKCIECTHPYWACPESEE